MKSILDITIVIAFSESQSLFIQRPLRNGLKGSLLYLQLTTVCNFDSHLELSRGISLIGITCISCLPGLLTYDSWTYKERLRLWRICSCMSPNQLLCIECICISKSRITHQLELLSSCQGGLMTWNWKATTKSFLLLY